MSKKWNIYKEPVTEVKKFSKEIGVSELLGRLLWHRDIRTAEEAARFLHPETEQEFYDPFLMQDMDKASERICKAIKEKERIVVYGDYDVDGITATSVLTKNLRLLGASVDYYIPDRQTEGYGFNLAALQKLADDGYSLLISVDCGIASVEDVAAMKGQMDIIITDHHLPGDELPMAVAVVNPHRRDCSYPDKELAGVGVAFKLCQALWKSLHNKDFYGDLELVALGTIADIVPLLGENRKIVKMGLSRMPETESLGLQALIDVASLKGKPIASDQVGFVLAPRLNAAGRIGSAMEGVRLLLAEDDAEAKQLAKQMNEENTHRQEIEREILVLAEQKLMKAKTSERHSIVLDGEGWHPGVIGIVASRLVDKYFLPTIIISREGNRCKGSCRSIPGLHMYDALYACKEYLTGFGGHSQAAGINLTADCLNEFRQAFDDYVAVHLSEDDYIPMVDIEFEWNPADLSFELIEEIAKLEPYGMGNPCPLLGCRSIRGANARPIGREGQHLSFYLENRAVSVSAVAWNKSSYAGIVNAEAMDIVYVPKINEWQGRKNIECFLEELEPARQGRVFPSRDVLAQIYRFLRDMQRNAGNIPFDSCELTVQFSKRQPISLYTMECGLRVLEELGLLHGDLMEHQYVMPPAPKEKLDLMASPFYRRNTMGD